jgi:YegS/Rv2252/BmrU family lipid kinase
MKYWLIFNPGSRGGKNARKIEHIKALLNARQIQYTINQTKTLSDAYSLSTKGNQLGYDVIVAIGGDGTINQVINGFFDEDGARISDSKFGVIYTGTSPDFCKSLQIPLRIDEAVEILVNPKSFPIAIGKVELLLSPDKTNKKPTVRYFACCANVGLGPLLAYHANGGIRKILGDTLGTFVSLIRCLFEYTPQNLKVKLDDKWIEVESVTNISIGKTHYIASGIQVKNHLKRNDRQFYYLSIQKLKLTKLGHVIKVIYSGKDIVNTEQITMDYCKEIEISGDSNIRVEFDGDPAGYLPCRITNAKDTLDVICKC